MVRNYLFDEPLVEGLIKSRPNRFIMMVYVNGKTVKCHCPATGRIGGMVFENVPCLLSRSRNKKRKTLYTVEAISVNKPSAKHRKWVGINQNAANRYVEFFLKTGEFRRMVEGNDVQREVSLGRSRIDFKVGNTFVEVKTFLSMLPFGNRVQYTKQTKSSSFDRLIKHFKDLGDSLKTGNRAVVLLCFMYDADAFSPPKPDKSNIRVYRSARNSSRRGVENWQVNLRINRKGVELRDYFKLNLF